MDKTVVRGGDKKRLGELVSGLYSHILLWKPAKKKSIFQYNISLHSKVDIRAS